MEVVRYCTLQARQSRQTCKVKGGKVRGRHPTNNPMATHFSRQRTRPHSVPNFSDHPQQRKRQKNRVLTGKYYIGEYLPSIMQSPPLSKSSKFVRFFQPSLSHVYRHSHHITHIYVGPSLRHNNKCGGWDEPPGTGLTVNILYKQFTGF
ncbi:hypothetical protein ACLOJK_029168 [Asimina triloba]